MQILRTPKRKPDLLVYSRSEISLERESLEKMSHFSRRWRFLKWYSVFSCRSLEVARKASNKFLGRCWAIRSTSSAGQSQQPLGSCHCQRF
jgi:hypothetical protein